MQDFAETPFKGVPSKVQMPMGSSSSTGLIPYLRTKLKSQKNLLLHHCQQKIVLATLHPFTKFLKEITKPSWERN